MTTCTHTHVGYRYRTGYYRRKVDGLHVSGDCKTHALTGGPDTYRSLCGETVWAVRLDDFGFPYEGGPKNVKVAGGELAVTCRRCRKILEGA